MRLQKFLIIAGLGLFSGHCVSKGGDQSGKAAVMTIHDTSEGPMVAKKWQTKFLNWLSTTGTATEGWALFTGGGLTGAGEFGNVMVVGNQDKADVYFAASGKEEAIKSDTASSGKLPAFLHSVNTTLGTGLADHWENGFDMLEYEFVHVVKDGNTLTVQKRIKWRFGRSKCLEHCDLQKDFQMLVK